MFFLGLRPGVPSSLYTKTQKSFKLKKKLNNVNLIFFPKAQFFSSPVVVCYLLVRGMRLAILLMTLSFKHFSRKSLDQRSWFEPSISKSCVAYNYNCSYDTNFEVFICYCPRKRGSIVFIIVAKFFCVSLWTR